MKQEEKHELAASEIKNPGGVVDYGSRVAAMLQDIVSKKKKKVVINNEQYLEFEDWQTVAKFYNVSATVEWVKPLCSKDGSEIIGYEARANAIRRDGSVVSSAESMCLKTEKLWTNKEIFQVRSMAQTRACAKSLRNVFSWVVVLAGYQSNVAEEEFK